MGAVHRYERYVSARLLDITSQKTVISRFLFDFLRVFFLNSLTFHLLCRHSQTATS